MYLVKDIKIAQCNLEPLVCRFCNSEEVVYMQGVSDGHCQQCGKWQT